MVSQSKRPHGLLKINLSDLSYSSNSFKTTSQRKRKLSDEGITQVKGGVVIMIVICAHVPMSLRARTSVPDLWSGNKVAKRCGSDFLRC